VIFDLLLSETLAIPRGDFLVYLRALPTFLSATTRDLRGVISFEETDRNSRWTSAFPGVAYSLPEWWITEKVPDSWCAESLLRYIDKIASELWVEKLAIECELEKQRGGNADCRKCRELSAAREELRGQ
jgi:hypothetical protein